MKKLSLATFGIIIIAVIYYVTSGSTQLISQMKSQVNTELASLQTQGFSVQGRETGEKKEHFVISFDEPEKIAAYFAEHGAQLSVDDIEVFKGLEIGVDLNYLADAYSGISFDLYPLSLPESITSSANTPEDKKILTQLQQMLEKKTFLIHCDINKLGTGFKGYMKDIDEVLTSETTVKMVLNKLEFSGDIKEDTVQSMQQTLQSVSVDADDTFNFSLSGLKSNYSITGATLYDYKTDYSIEKITMQEKGATLLEADHFEAISASTVKNSLANTTLKTKTKSIIITNKDNKIVLDTLLLDMKAENLDTKALEALGEMDANNEKEVNAALQKLISQGVQLEIPAFSVANIENLGQKMEGFHLSTLLHIDKSLNIAALQQNPLLALNTLNVNLDLSLSKELYTLIAQQPQAVMVMMLFQPKNVNGKKVYNVELKDGSLTVNGSPVM